MEISDNEGICPYCGKEKAGQQTWSKALAPGTVLNSKILIGNILGKGGYGITYIGYDMLLEYKVAVKEFFPDEMVDRAEDGKTVLVLDEVNDEEYQKETKAYLREARVLAEFSKFPGIVVIKDLFYENNTGYLIMEFLQSGNLRKYVDSHGGWLPVEEALELMEPVISILGRLHKSGLIHRDISPDNIMMDGDGSVKLIDFGGSRKLGLNNQQVFLGKWGFAPSEQMLSKISEQGPWTDIYGICATLYCMMTGDVPQSSYERNEKDELIDIANYTIQIDKRVAKAIMKGLSMDPKGRQQSIEELYQDLYGVPLDRKSTQPVFQEKQSSILKDRNGRIWFGEYPMDELTGSQLTSDIVYADFDRDDVATVGEMRILRMPVFKENFSTENSNILSMMRVRQNMAEEITGYRYFVFNALSWKIVSERGNRVTLQAEYILDFQPFDDKKYLKMSEKDIAKVRSGIYWEKSSIREWLNSVFVRRAFKKEEREKLKTTKISTPVSALSERTTYDKVYLPSVEEVRYGFDMDASLQRGKTRRELDTAPCSQYAAGLAGKALLHSDYGLRSRGHIDEKESYRCAESYEGLALSDNHLTVWYLNKCMGIRPVICVDADEIENLV